MSQTIAIGTKGTFHSSGEGVQPAAAEVVHVWSATCVNLRTEQGRMPTSVPVVEDGALNTPSGYFFVPDQAADSLETAIVATGADVEAAIESEHYFTAADGQRGAGGADVRGLGDPLELLTFCVVVLRNGFTVTGESACASAANFKPEIGRRIARENAVAKIWPLMGYELRTRLAGPTDKQVDRFLTWPVPADVHPDGTPGVPGRTGTNLLSAPQAKAMLGHVLAAV